MLLLQDFCFFTQHFDTYRLHNPCIPCSSRQLTHLVSHVGAYPHPQTSLFRSIGRRGCFQANCAAFRMWQEVGGEIGAGEWTAERRLKLSPTLDRHIIENLKHFMRYNFYFLVNNFKGNYAEWHIAPHIPLVSESVTGSLEFEDKDWFKTSPDTSTPWPKRKWNQGNFAISQNDSSSYYFFQSRVYTVQVLFVPNPHPVVRTFWQLSFCAARWCVKFAVL